MSRWFLLGLAVVGLVVVVVLMRSGAWAPVAVGAAGAAAEAARRAARRSRERQESRALDEAAERAARRSAWAGQDGADAQAVEDRAAESARDRRAELERRLRERSG